MILCITPNPALDVTYTFPDLTIGATHRVAAPSVRAGGKGVNVARVAHEQGYSTQALVTLGGISGKLFGEELLSSGIPHRVVPISGATRQSIALVASGEATVLNEFGQPLKAPEVEALLAAVTHEVTHADVVTVSGSLPPHAPADFLPSLISAAGARPTIVDTSGPALLTAAQAGADILKPNAEELADATGLSRPLDGARKLIDLGASLVFASLGEEGLLVVSREHSLRARLPYVLEGNPTGAGDAAVAGIATAIVDAGGLEALNLETVTHRAVAWSAAAVLMPFAGEISPDHTRIINDITLSEG